MDERIRKKMKTYKHLYEKFISEENIKLAIQNGTKKKRHRPLFNKIYNKHHLLEQIVDGEEFPRYIRMTGQQIERIKKIFFSGEFCSYTIPNNKFRLDSTSGYYIFSCPEDKQVIRVPQEGMKNIYTYYEKHREHIAHYDVQFRSRH